MKVAPKPKTSQPQRKPPARKPLSVPELRLEIEYVNPNSIKLWEDNPRRNDKAAVKLAESIRAHGFGQPVTVRSEDETVYKGNTRVKAARLLKMESIPVMLRSYPDVENAKRDALADNRMQEAAEWDVDKLAEMFKEREEVDIARLAIETGFEQMEIQGLREGIVPAMPEGFDDSQLPTGLSGIDMVGFDATTGRLLITYRDEDEKVALCAFLGVDGKKVVYPFDEIGTAKKSGLSARRKS